MNERGSQAEQSARDKEPAVFLHAIERRYHQGAATLEILKAAELAVWPGQSVALIAPSGTGKSTLLHIAGLLEHPDAGEVYVDGTATSTLSDAERTRIRRTEIGFVYQFHHLLPEFSAVENVMMPQLIRGLSRKEARKRADELLSYLGLKERLEHRPCATVRRGAAARRDRARGRQRAAHPARRRADRQSRSAHRQPRVQRDVAAGPRLGLRRRDRDPQHGARAAHGPARHAAGGPGGRGELRVFRLLRDSDARGAERLSKSLTMPAPARLHDEKYPR